MPAESSLRTWNLCFPGSTLSFSGEVHNLTDAKTYDFFGVPKPGRSTYFKVTASL